MAVLDRRVQVLFDEERYARLERAAAAQGVSVGAFIRAAVEQSVGSAKTTREDALRRLLERADAHPSPAVSDWGTEKDAFDRALPA